MPRLRKLRRKQKYQYNVNRSRLNKKLTKLPDITCEAVKKAWDKKKSLTDNLTSMGLVADPNTMHKLKIPSGKDVLRKMMSPQNVEEEEEEEEGLDGGAKPKNHHVVQQLEKEAKDGFAAKKSNPHPLPKEMFRKLTAFLDKYGEDFEAMSYDHTNYNQETPAQLKSQVNRLKSIPSQWIPYLKSRGLVESAFTDKDDKPTAEDD